MKPMRPEVRDRAVRPGITGVLFVALLVGGLVTPMAADARTASIQLPVWAGLRVVAISWEPLTGHLILEATVTASGTAILSADLSVCWPGQCIAIGTTGAALGRIEAGVIRQRAFAARARVGLEGFIDFALEARPEIAGLQRVAAKMVGLSPAEREIVRREVAGMNKAIPLGQSFAVTLNDDLAVLLPSALVPVLAGPRGFWLWTPPGHLGDGLLAATFDRYRAALASPSAVAALDATVPLVQGAEPSIPLSAPGPLALQLNRAVVLRLLAMNRACHLAQAGDHATALAALKKLAATAPADGVSPFIHANLGVVHLKLVDKFAAADAWRHALEGLPAWPGLKHRLQEITQ